MIGRDLMKSPKVWIVVLNYNGADDTLQCIESIYKLDYDNFDVIVLDNHSKDNSEQEIILAFVMQYSILILHTCGFLTMIL